VKEPVKLRFCPDTNNLLEPKVDYRRNKLMYVSTAPGSDHVEEADPSGSDAEANCVYRNIVNQELLLVEIDTNAQKFVGDPTIPKDYAWHLKLKSILHSR